MAVQFNAKTRTFHLYNSEISYIFRVRENEQLEQIYPNLVGCNDLSKLTGQLLGIIAKLL